MWFDLFCNTVIKHRILELDIWNYNKTGFLIGHILSTLVVTSFEGHGRAKKIQPGNQE